MGIDEMGGRLKMAGSIMNRALYTHSLMSSEALEVTPQDPIPVLKQTFEIIEQTIRTDWFDG